MLMRMLSKDPVLLSTNGDTSILQLLFGKGSDSDATSGYRRSKDNIFNRQTKSGRIFTLGDYAKDRVAGDESEYTSEGCKTIRRSAPPKTSNSTTTSTGTTTPGTMNMKMSMKASFFSGTSRDSLLFPRPSAMHAPSAASIKRRTGLFVIVLQVLAFWRFAFAQSHGLNNPVISLQAGNFESHMNSGHRYFIKFFAPWCTHCKRIKSTWETLAQNVNHDDSLETRIAEVDCTTNGDVCTKVGIRGYPTLMYVDVDGEKYQYSGSHSLETLTRAAQQQVSSREVTSGEGFEFTKTGESRAQPKGGSVLRNTDDEDENLFDGSDESSTSSNSSIKRSADSRNRPFFAQLREATGIFAASVAETATHGWNMLMSNMAPKSDGTPTGAASKTGAPASSTTGRAASSTSSSGTASSGRVDTSIGSTDTASEYQEAPPSATLATLVWSIPEMWPKELDIRGFIHDFLSAVGEIILLPERFFGFIVTDGTYELPARMSDEQTWKVIKRLYFLGIPSIAGICAALVVLLPKYY
ncbi:unnamed protein product [Amoebophrya sp. A25]|nr:unnamed protein product [Amoebophrya sp. A25]|eukprot:GSA25T00014262001.1